MPKVTKFIKSISKITSVMVIDGMVVSIFLPLEDEGGKATF